MITLTKARVAGHPILTRHARYGSVDEVNDLDEMAVGQTTSRIASPLVPPPSHRYTFRH